MAQFASWHKLGSDLLCIPRNLLTRRSVLGLKSLLVIFFHDLDEVSRPYDADVLFHLRGADFEFIRVVDTDILEDRLGQIEKELLDNRGDSIDLELFVSF